MTAPIARLSRLQTNIAVTERSRRFYNGTYKWDSDGFTDDHGVYREFDCYDPAARAPTPLPPMFSDDIEDTDQNTMVPNNISGPTKATDAPALRPDTPLGNIHGNVATSKHLCGVPYSEKAAVMQEEMEATLPKSPYKSVTDAHMSSPSSSDSTLSPVPSDLSDQDREAGIGVKAASTARQGILQMLKTPSKTESRPKSKIKTTRSVAQKVRKGGKRTALSRSSPVKTRSGGLEDVGYSGSFEWDSKGRKRSTRHAKSEGNY